MLYSYHDLFRFDEKENSILSDFAECYSQVSRKANATINKQNHHVFQLNLKALKLDQLSHKELVKLYKEQPFDLPTIQLE